MSVSNAAYTPIVEPPSYSDSPYDDNTLPEAGADNVPDDFKYSTNVASCEFSVRQVFLRKVYSLLVVQVLTTFAIGVLFRFNQPLQNWALNNQWAFWVSFVGSVGTMIGAYIKGRNYPLNLIFLGAFTIFESYGVGMVCALTDSNVVIQALALTLIMFVGLTIFSFQTKYDFTSLYTYIGVGLWGLMGWGLVFMFIPHGATSEIIYSGFGALIFTVYIIADTQSIMKKFHPEDEVIATITLYLDILNLFLYILRILNSRND